MSAAICRAALIASHSVGATTPTKFPFTTTWVLGKLALSKVPTEISVEPSVFGWMTRPCSMFGRRTSVTQTSFAATFEGVTVLAYERPMTVYSLVGFTGGLPVTVNPYIDVRSPDTGMVSFRSCPCTSSP